MFTWQFKKRRKYTVLHHMTNEFAAHTRVRWQKKPKTVDHDIICQR